MSTESLIRDIRAVLDAHESGDGIEWEAERLSDFEEDGFSRETSEYGARRNSDVDDALAELRRGDKWANEVADAADRWFAFDLEDWPEVAPESEEERAYVREARNNSWGPSLIFGRTSYHAPFKLKLPPGFEDPFAGRYFDFIDGHAFVHLRGNDTPQKFCERYAADLIRKAAELRAAAEERDNGIIRPPTD